MDRTQLETDLRHDEGSRLKRYRCPTGHWTIGVGHNLDAGAVTLDGVTFDQATRTITADQETALLAHDIDVVLAGLDRQWPWWRNLPDPWQRALANMGFQMGLGSLGKFKRMWAALHLRDGVTASREALASEWAVQTPERAARVAALFLEGKQS